MMKINFMHMLLLYYPLMLNSLIIILMMIPYKLNKLHPLLMIIILIFIVFLISFKMNILLKTWMSFFLILILIGGLMIIFMYITSLMNNELFLITHWNIKMNLMKFLMYLSLISILLMYYPSYPHLSPPDLWSLLSDLYEELDEFLLSTLYNNMLFTTLFIMYYLFYSMICIMNICYKFKTPLRQLLFYE